jgi:hypothetical protein
MFAQNLPTKVSTVPVNSNEDAPALPVSSLALSVSDKGVLALAITESESPL